MQYGKEEGAMIKVALALNDYHVVKMFDRTF